MSKCIYCNTKLEDNSALDVCWKCGVGVWGENMFNAILQNMENAKETGDLYQGSVTEQPQRKEEKPAPALQPIQSQPSAGLSIVSDAVTQLEQNQDSESSLDGMQETHLAKPIPVPETPRAPPEPDDAAYLLDSTNESF